LGDLSYGQYIREDEPVTEKARAGTETEGKPSSVWLGLPLHCGADVGRSRNRTLLIQRANGLLARDRIVPDA
jgi:hypothetical protein